MKFIRQGTKLRASALVLGIACLAGSAQAGPYSDVVFFGDSLSDTGNVRALTNFLGLPVFPSYPGADALGRFSNGKSWVEHLADGLGLPGASNPSYRLFNGATIPGPLPLGNLAPAGNNFAYGGARTDASGRFDPLPTGLFAQANAWATINGGVADPNALYVVVAGGNDLRLALDSFSGNTPADDAARTTAAAAAVINIRGVVGGLLMAGAQHIMLSNLPDLGVAPESVGLGREAAATDITLKFNQGVGQIDSFFDVFFGIDLDIRLLDFYGLAEAVVADAASGGMTFGITNVGSPCIEPGMFSGQYFAPDATDADPPGGNCAASLFSDDLHPSARAHELLGAAALRLAVPVPGTLLLVALAGVALMRLRRRP